MLYFFYETFHKLWDLVPGICAQVQLVILKKENSFTWNYFDLAGVLLNKNWFDHSSPFPKDQFSKMKKKHLGLLRQTEDSIYSDISRLC